MSTTERKNDHIQINLTRDVQSGLSAGFEKYHFVHCALPEFDLDDVDTATNLFGKQLSFPLVISSMTGGTAQAGNLNRVMAQAAEKAGVAMGLGSMRAAIEDKTLESTFKVRDIAPSILLFANLGAVQLNYSYTIEHCKRVIDMVSADALILHLNPLQEALQPEGDTKFSGLLNKIEDICHNLPVPVVVKEVGWGLDGRTARKLVNAGVKAIDVAGAGGTSWSQVEKYRQKNPVLAKTAEAFRDWGIPTAESIRIVHKKVPRIPIISSGGLRNGIDLAKSIALGATLGGMAGPFLKAASKSTEDVFDLISEIKAAFIAAMFASGVKNIRQLSKVHLTRDDSLAF